MFPNEHSGLDISVTDMELSPLVDKPEWAGHVTEIITEDPHDRPPRVVYEYRGRFAGIETPCYLAVIRGGAVRRTGNDVEFYMNGLDLPHLRAVTDEEHTQAVVGSCLSTLDTFCPVWEAQDAPSEAVADGGFVFGGVESEDEDGEVSE